MDTTRAASSSFRNTRFAAHLTRPRTSLVAKVSLLIGLVSVSMSILFVVSGTIFIRDNELKRQLSHISELLTTVQSTVQIASFTNDKTLATEVARGLMTNRSISAVRITSGDHIIAEIKKNTAGGGAPHLVRKAVSSPFDKRTLVGEIVLTADSDFILSQATQYSSIFAALRLLEVIAVTVLVALVMLRTVVRPITLVAAELQRIEGHAGASLLTPNGHEQNEIGHLTHAFNRMICSMKNLLDKEQGMREEVARSEMRFRTLAENSPDIISRYDLDFHLIFANPAYALETGIPLTQALNRCADECQTWRPTMPLEQFKARLQRVIDTGAPDCMLWEWESAIGQAVCHEMYVVAEYDVDGHEVGVLAIGRNITERKQIERQLFHQATHDTLTGLFNRACFKDRLQHAINQSRRGGGNLAVIFIDLDKFKDVNDSLGHEVGDELLKILANRMRAVLRESDTVARFGGDEFVILLEHSDTSHDRDAVVQKVFETIAQPCDIGVHHLYPGASLGIAVYPADGEDGDTLMRNADTAMYVAKEQGRNGYRYFRADMNDELQTWMEISNNLRLAIENKEFVLHYQPKARVDTGEFVGMEALIRWHHPAHGLIFPAHFIPVAEKNGLIGAIGQWVLNEACRQARSWLDEGLDPGRIAVNLSAAQCKGSLLPAQVRAILELHGLPGKHLEVEITESIVMDDAEESIRALGTLRGLGVHVSVDDFGTGYSSLSYLRRLPVDKLKIDKSFVEGFETDFNDAQIIRAIIAMAHVLSLTVIAEGVETASQLESLRAAGCDQFQGDHYSRPLSPNDMTTLLGTRRSPLEQEILLISSMKKLQPVCEDAEQQLVVVERDLRLKELVLDRARDAVYLVDFDLRFVYVNEEACRALGYPREELIGLTPSDIDPDTTQQVAQRILAQTISEGAFMFETRHQRRDGSLFQVEIRTSMFEYQGQVLGMLLVRDITDRKRIEGTLAVCEQDARTLIDNMPDTIARYNRDCRRTFVNRAFSEIVEGGAAALLGATPSEFPGGPNAAIYETKINEVFSKGQAVDFELKWTGGSGREVCSHIRVAPEHDGAGNMVSVLAVGRDITELNEHRSRTSQMVFYDSLTSLPNRALFNNRLREMLAAPPWHDQLSAVMFLDLDRFKAVNDSLGHSAGDALLRETAARLTRCVRSDDTVARMGGDEFAILLPKIRSGEDLGSIAGKLLQLFNEPFLLAGREVFLTCCIGVAQCPADSSDADDLLKQADSAMYFAKRSGRNNFRFYSKDLTAGAYEKLMLESELCRALERKELELYYQPKVSLADGGVIGSEALLRWNNPLRGMVAPDQFISIAEDSGMIVDIGEWVLRDACRTACGWNGGNKPLHKVAINLSARQFQSGDLVKTVNRILEETCCDPRWIELEITESLLLDERDEVLGILTAFRSIGISIAIDDFGTGYSSLSYLARFPIDTIKIDRSFTSRVAQGGHHAALVKAIISIAHSLKQQVVAEGVETLEQAAVLQAYGCHIAQGYLYCKPIPKSAFEALPRSFGQDALVG
ncbi:MAG: EAL domain-containing protein [Rhodoferax sp.]|nr:EAL domain-containing protein [Rhodoferax sp.]